MPFCTMLLADLGEGVDLFRALVRHADVVAENFGVGTMDRLGIGYDELKKVNPRLTYATVTAFGQYGPYAQQRGYDILAQALSGYMSITGFPEHPPLRSGQSISEKLSETPGKIESLAPLLGEHNEAIFVDLLGYSKDDLSRWQDDGVI
jgi:formyl-CoA transferase